MLTKQFFLGGNATFTVQNDTTGEYRTYKIHKTEPNERFPIPAYMVALMTGPDNVNSYTYMGKLNPETGELKLKIGGRFTEDSAAARGFRWTMHKVWNNLPIPAGIQVRHEGKCGCCGRKLTTPESLDRGIGPECWSRLGRAA
jgi:hypothetical protein